MFENSKVFLFNTRESKIEMDKIIININISTMDNLNW